ncbi:MAG: hypothetical protein HN348_13950 [Proteobacteria bacterium]|nr:hypothetical protein [Pseudomonadota bacterium]
MSRKLTAIAIAAVGCIPTSQAEPPPPEPTAKEEPAPPVSPNTSAASRESFHEAIGVNLNDSDGAFWVK